MSQWSGAHRAFAVKQYLKCSDSLVRARRAFCTHFNIRRVSDGPSTQLIRCWVQKFRQEGTTVDQTHTEPSTSAATPERVAQVRREIMRQGRVIQKLECRPYVDNCYMKHKKESIRKTSAPIGQVQQLDRIVHNFKPVSEYIPIIEYQERKKAEGKKARYDKEAILNMLFAAFEKHQYYNIKDLQKIARQPIVYLKEILKEVCNYNLKNPHKNMWELKPEYRHYKKDAAEEVKTNEQDFDSDSI